MAGIYIHIPFCKQACSYCDFHFSTNLKLQTAFLGALKNEIRLKAAYLMGNPIETLYFGGGTPTILSVVELEQIFQTLDLHFDLTQLQEVTIEANPDDLSKSYLSDLKQYTPINRLSIGIQSFDDMDLELMNRAHDSKMAHKVITWSTELGFDQINADLIFALPWQQNPNYLSTNLELFAKYSISHISCYQLTIEAKTLLAHQINNNRWTEHTDKRIIEEFYLVEEFLESQGFLHYEISNYALPNHFALHNSNYWRGQNYLGLGPSAHSLLNDIRYFNIANNASYIKHMTEETKLWTMETLTLENRWNEHVMTGIRTVWGANIEYLLSILPNKKAQLMAGIEQLVQKNQIQEPQNGRIILTSEGKVLCDSIALELMV